MRIVGLSLILIGSWMIRKGLKKEKTVKTCEGNCYDCRFSLADGDMGFICCNRNSDQYGEYTGGCDLWEEYEDDTD